MYVRVDIDLTLNLVASVLDSYPLTHTARVSVNIINPSGTDCSKSNDVLAGYHLTVTVSKAIGGGVSSNGTIK